MKGFHYVLMDQATDGTDGGAGGTDGAAAGSGEAAGGLAGTGGAAGGQAESTGAGDNAGAAGSGAATGTALQAGAGPAPAIPEKFQVKKEDGTLDLEASSLKLAENYAQLEKRMGAGDAPPKTAEEYVVTVPDQFKDAIDPKTEPMLQDFLKKAHAAGYTQKQIDLVMGEYFAVAPQLVAGAQQLSSEDCTAQLRTEWKTDDVYKAEVGKAYKAAVGYGGGDAEGIIKDHGNDPRIVRLLARVGAEMAEDTSINAGDRQSGSGDINTLMASEAYTNAKHPDNARVSEQVRKFFENQAAAAEKAGNGRLM